MTSSGMKPYQDTPLFDVGSLEGFISLGILLRAVAEADDNFLPAEEEKVREVLTAYGDISLQDLPIVLRAIEEAAINRIDLYSFASEMGTNLLYEAKLGIITNLFRIASVDMDLAHDEHEMIRKVAGLLKMEHGDFINMKIKVKKEFGMDTAGL